MSKTRKADKFFLLAFHCFGAAYQEAMIVGKKDATRNLYVDVFDLNGPNFHFWYGDLQHF